MVRVGDSYGSSGIRGKERDSEEEEMVCVSRSAGTLTGSKRVVAGVVDKEEEGKGGARRGKTGEARAFIKGEEKTPFPSDGPGHAEERRQRPKSKEEMAERGEAKAIQATT